MTTEVKVPEVPRVSPDQASDGDLNTTFGIPKGLRDSLAVGLLALTGLVGCGPSVAERIEHVQSLPRPTSSDVLHKPEAYFGREIALEGFPKLVRDDTHTTTGMILMPMIFGKTTTLMPIPQQVTHYEYWYSVDTNSDHHPLMIHTYSTLEPNTYLSSGIIEKSSDGNPYLETLFTVYHNTK